MFADETTTKPVRPPRFLEGQYRSLPHRKISEETCRTLDYRVTKAKGQVIEFANYYDDGELIAQHLRFPDKQMPWIGAGTQAGLWGKNLWKPGGKRIIVCEGEIDALTVCELQDNRWPVVGIPRGTKDAANVIRANLEYLNSFETVVFAFDMDEPGRKAARQCAALIKPGHAAIAELPESDCNDVWVKRGKQPLATALWNASPFRPDGIVHVSEVKATSVQQKVWPFPWRSMTKALFGQRSGEISMYTSGTGMGKSTILREIAYHHLQQGRTVGMLMLEESVDETRHDMMSLLVKKPVRQILAARELNTTLTKMGEEAIDFELCDDLDEHEYDEAKGSIGQLPLYLYDHHGSNLAEDLIPKLEYLASGLGCDVIILDHITAVVAEMDGGNERQDIDHLMKSLRSLVERTNVHLCIVTQLKKTDGKPYEEGGRITLQALRGSGSLASVPNSVLALERDQQDPDPIRANTVIVRSLKGRFNGCSGVVCALRYDKPTGRFQEVDFAFDDDGTILFEPEDYSPPVESNNDTNLLGDLDV